MRQQCFLGVLYRPIDQIRSMAHRNKRPAKWQLTTNWATLSLVGASYPTIISSTFLTALANSLLCYENNTALDVSVSYLKISHRQPNLTIRWLSQYSRRSSPYSIDARRRGRIVKQLQTARESVLRVTSFHLLTPQVTRVQACIQRSPKLHKTRRALSRYAPTRRCLLNVYNA